MLKKLCKIVLAVVMMATTIAANGVNVFAKEVDAYQIYPQPHEQSVKSSSYIMRKDVNLVFDKTIDEATHKRVQEVLDTKDMQATISAGYVSGKLNVLVGTKGSEGYVDTYVSDHYDVEDSLFEKTDAYFLASDQGTISILGAHTDAAFYGVTTLLQVFQQLESYTIHDFTMEDYADVVSRGFIEGYYGNPWSIEDRVDLMNYGGYYKLNSYFYAPKDDPKHNARWKELYTEEELVGIKKLADAGNASKCRFVFALHPFMSNTMRFDTESNYQADLAILKAKYQQVIDNGVRQIALLADDARDVGKDNYKRVLADLTEFLKEEQKTYPDLKVTLPFCPVSYGGYGESWFGDLGDNVQIVMTGGRVWGEVSNNFTSTFTATTGRGPYMWINWPCTDNSNKHLIMGGNATFLQPGVDPANIQGIILNPMEHSEPSKAAIFANATYAWNIWETEEEADKAWKDSFTYVDHNSPISTPASDALRELSKHMINQNMDSRVTVLQESVDLKPLLEGFKASFAAGTLTMEQIDQIAAEFIILKEAAQTYMDNPGTPKTRDQILPFLECWLDTSDAVLNYLESIRAYVNGDTTTMVEYYSKGQASFNLSKSHTFISKWTEVVAAEVGVQHIVPFIQLLDGEMGNKVKTMIDPSVVTQKFITNRNDRPSGNINNVFDGKPSTEIIYQSPNSIQVGEYVGVMFDKAIDVQQINFELGANSNMKDTFAKAKIQYTVDGKTWVDLDGEIYTLPNSVEKSGLTLKAIGIRMIATEIKTNTWLGVRDILINKKSVEEPETQTYKGNFTLHDMVVRSGKISSLSDGDDGTEAMFSYSENNVADKDTIIENADITFTMDAAVPVGVIRVAQGASNAGDVLKKAVVEYLDKDGNWTKLGDFTNAKIQEFDAEGLETKAIRIRNIDKVPVWWRLGEVSVFAPKQAAGADTKHVYTDINTNITASLEVGKGSLSAGNVTLNAGNYIGLRFDNIKEIANIMTSDLPNGVVLQTSMNEIVWTDVVDDSDKDAKFIRLVNTSEEMITFALDTFEIYTNDIAPISVESTIAINEAYGSGDMRRAGNVANVFDNSLSTSASIAGYPIKDSTITFDLGQSIAFDSIRYYIEETQKNYIRDAQFAISADKENWTDVLFVGDGEENDTFDNTVAKDAAYLTHDNKNPGYMYAQGSDIGGIEARYIRVTMTTNYSYRFVAFNEIEINGGTYLPISNDKDVVASCMEELGKAFVNMFDGDITSTWRPSAANGTMEYRLSAPQGAKTIRLVQNGSISNARVEGALYDIASKTEEHVTLGTLNQMISEFMIPEGKQLLRTIVVWEDAIPELSEILTTTIEQAVDKTVLLEELEKDIDTSTWTISSKGRYDSAYQTARDIYESAYASQDSVKSALGSLKNAVSTAENVGDAQALQNLIDAFITNDDGMYTQRSYATYTFMIEKAKKALENKEDLTKATCDQLLTEITISKANLVYSNVQKELAILCVEDMQDFIAELVSDDYTEVSYQTLQDAYTALQALTSSSEEHTPSVYSEGVQALNVALEELVSVEKLRAAITSAQALSEKDYTADSYAALTKAINDAQVVFVNGTTEDVTQAMDAIATAIQQLVPASEKENIEKDILREAIQKALVIRENDLENIAQAVVDQFNTALDSAVSVYENTASTPKEMMDAWFALANAMHYLDFKADKTQLHALIEKAEEINLELYKEEGKAEFVDALAYAKKVSASDTALNDESIAKAYNGLSDAISKLQRLDAVDTTLLQYFIQQAEMAMKDAAYYAEDDAWTHFMEMYQAAKNAITAETQAAIDAAASALADAYEDIRLIADEERLGALASFIAEMDALDAAQFNAQDYARMQETKAFAQQLYANKRFTLEEFTAFEQQQNQAMEIIKRVQEEGNVEATTPPATPEDTENTPQQPTQPEAPLAPEMEKDAEVNAPSETTKQMSRIAGTAKTGDTTNMGIMIGAMVIALGAGIFVVLRKKKMSKK